MQSFFRVVFIFITLGLVAAGEANEKPLWEAGIGIASLNMPDYNGSDEQRNYFIPIPYLMYRGEILKVDQKGVRGDLFKSDRLKLDISANAGVPVNSEHNGTRRGMPDLDPTLEVGPSLQVFLSRDALDKHVWSLHFPLRAVIATDFFHYETAGWVFAPHLNFYVKDTGPGGGWKMGFALGALYATERFHDYYYEVDTQYVTAERPVYDAQAGYGGIRLGMSMSKRFPIFWLGAFARYDNLSGTVFEDSPLVKQKHAFLIGAGLSWVFAKSKQLVQVHE